MAIREGRDRSNPYLGLQSIHGIARIGVWGTGRMAVRRRRGLPAHYRRFALPNAPPISVLRHGIAKRWGLVLAASLDRTHHGAWPPLLARLGDFGQIAAQIRPMGGFWGRDGG